MAEIRARWSGHRLRAEVNVAVYPNLSGSEGHEVAREVNHQLMHRLAFLESAVVHVDPTEQAGKDTTASTTPTTTTVTPPTRTCDPPPAGPGRVEGAGSLPVGAIDTRDRERCRRLVTEKVWGSCGGADGLNRARRPLFEYLNDGCRDLKSRYVFTSQRATRLTEAGVHHWFRKLRSNATRDEWELVGDVTFHDLRHDFAHRAREAGWHLEEVAYYLGHVTRKETPAIGTTARYTQVSREDVKEKGEPVKDFTHMLCALLTYHPEPPWRSRRLPFTR